MVGSGEGLKTRGSLLKACGAAETAEADATAMEASVGSGARFFNWSFGLFGASAADVSIGEGVSAGVCSADAVSAAEVVCATALAIAVALVFS